MSRRTLNNNFSAQFDAAGERGSTASEPYNFAANLQGSYSFWFKMTAGVTSNTRIFRLSDRLDCNIEANTNRFFCWFHSPTNGSGVAVYLDTGVNSNDGLWHHIAVVKNATTITLYKDGVAKTPISTTEMTNSTSTFQIGDGNTGVTANVCMKNVGIWGEALTSAEVTSLYGGFVPRQNALKCFYRLDEGTGLVAKSSIVNFGNMTLTSGTTWNTSAPERMNSAPEFTFDAYRFDGVTQYATIPDNSAYSIGTTGALTVSAWMRPLTNQSTLSEGTGYVNWLGKSDFGSPNHVEWQHRLYNITNTETNMRNNESSFYIFNTTGGIGVSSDYIKETTDVNRWQHYVGIADGTYVMLYKNGKLLQKMNYASTVTVADTTALIYLAHADNNGYLYGDIGPIKIWNRVLNESEVAAQYTTNENNPNGLVGHWVADSGNNRYTDLTSTANHGTNLNSPTFISNAYISTRPVPMQRNMYYPGPAMTLNGSTQYASITDASQTGLDLGTNDFVIAGWAQINTHGSVQTFVAKVDTGHTDAGQAGATGYDIIYNTSNGGVLQFRARSNVSGNQTITYPYPKDGKPHMFAVAFKRSGSSTGCQLWLDGAKVNQFSSFTATVDNDGLFVLGARSGSSRAQFLNGKIFCVGVWQWTTMPDTYKQIIDDVYYRKEGRTYTNGLVSWYKLLADANDSYGANNLTQTASPTFTTLGARAAA